MTYEEFADLAKKKKLKLTKRYCGIIYREKGWRGQKWDDTTNASWDSQLIPYKKYSYEAQTPDMPEHRFFRLRKKDFLALKLLTENKKGV